MAGPKKKGGQNASSKASSGGNSAGKGAGGDADQNDKKSKGKKGSSKAANDAAPPPQEAPKKPDTRTLIGGSSWTGKLPVNMLSEACQKQKWDKPEYTMRRVPDGFISTVILRKMNPKTKEVSTLPPFELPHSHKNVAAQPSAVEARHFAATWTLYRISNMKNIHMALPPNYRDLWKGLFTDLKKQETERGKGWQYEADPFAAKERIDAEQAEKLKSAANNSSPQGSGQQTLSGGKGRNTNPKHNWDECIKIEMGKGQRFQAETLIKAYTIWNPEDIVLPKPISEKLATELEGLGFRKSHVAEALAVCKDREEALEWLLIHVPEDDLPRWSLPEKYSVGVSVAASNLEQENAVRRLTEAGYSEDMCRAAQMENGWDEVRAASSLQNRLIQAVDDISDGQSPSKGDAVSSEEWASEVEAVEAIFGDRFKRLGKNSCQVNLQAPFSELNLVISKSALYPQALPTLKLLGKAPAYIKLSIYRRALKHASDSFLGEPMIFNIFDWVEENIQDVFNNPGKLSDISYVARPSSVQQQFKVRRKAGNHNKPVGKPLGTIGDAESTAILQSFQAKQNRQDYQKMLRVRQQLPAWKLRDNIVDTINNRQVTVISGETGSGKSTQCIQFVMDDMIQRTMGSTANMVCTQPRRISAIGLADRVSDERCDSVGKEVGYSIRGESRQTPGVTKVTFCTVGVLLRRMQTYGSEVSDFVGSLAGVSHVFVDEVHERSLDTDFLLALLRQALKKRKDLKVILMSATLDSDTFERYFRGSCSVGKVHIEGRTFPVNDYYLDDVMQMTRLNPGGSESDVAKAIQNIGMGINYDVIKATVESIHEELGSKPGGILIFLPGTMEIKRTIEALRNIKGVFALPLHASLDPAEQRRVFRHAPGNMRKVVASTNVAETSITIDDIVAVIDSGRVKETSYDPIKGIVRLQETWASQAACRQRRGRAGRVREGDCFKLFTRSAETKMLERPPPEIQRVPLEQLCLSVRAMGVSDIGQFLASTLTPPDSAAVESALNLLHQMRILEENHLTALGRHLAIIPADLRLGKLMVYGALFGCLGICIKIASILTARSPFLSPQEKREESRAARDVFSQNQGDLITDLAAYQSWQDVQLIEPPRTVRRWCDANFLSIQTLNEISSNAVQFVSSLKEAGAIPTSYELDRQDHSDYDKNNNDHGLLRALIAGAFQPQLAQIRFPDKKFAASMTGAIEQDPEAKMIKYFLKEAGRVFVHPSSTLFGAQQFVGNSAYMAYFSKISTSKSFIRDLTPFNAFSLLFFSGKISLDTRGRGLYVDDWIRLKGWPRIGVLVRRLRAMLDHILSQKLIAPNLKLPEEDAVIELVRKLIDFNGMDN